MKITSNSTRAGRKNNNNNKKQMNKINEITSKLFLAGDILMPEMHLRLDLPIVLAGNALQTKKEYKNSQKQEIKDIFINMNQIRVAFNIIWPTEI